ncbi:hypothetical protein EYC80_005312 [Monilinia laxa]|uniref:Uncharacterized protein n=1 Tax=Monilinia laxa TaxID=61186 RepID=A0A5N6KJK1_MONLA|nr:hypothetical protein EYC80_005312 [Monilinia laxa]
MSRSPLLTLADVSARLLFDPAEPIHIRDLTNMAKDGHYMRDILSDHMIGVLWLAYRTGVIGYYDIRLFQLPFTRTQNRIIPGTPNPGRITLRSSLLHAGQPFLDPDGNVLAHHGYLLLGTQGLGITDDQLDATPRSGYGFETIHTHPMYIQWVNDLLWLGGPPDTVGTYQRTFGDTNWEVIHDRVSSSQYQPGPGCRAQPIGYGNAYPYKGRRNKKATKTQFLAIGPGPGPNPGDVSHASSDGPPDSSPLPSPESIPGPRGKPSGGRSRRVASGGSDEGYGGEGHGTDDDSRNSQSPQEDEEPAEQEESGKQKKPAKKKDIAKKKGSVEKQPAKQKESAKQKRSVAFAEREAQLEEAFAKKETRLAKDFAKREAQQEKEFAKREAQQEKAFAKREGEIKKAIAKGEAAQKETVDARKAILADLQKEITEREGVLLELNNRVADRENALSELEESNQVVPEGEVVSAEVEESTDNVLVFEEEEILSESEKRVAKRKRSEDGADVAGKANAGPYRYNNRGKKLRTYRVDG